MKKRNIILAAFLALLTGCRDPQSTLDPAGPAAGGISRLSWIVFIIFIAVSIAMWILIVVAGGKRRGNLVEHAPVDEGGGQGWILIGGLAFPFVILAVIFTLGLITMSGFPIHENSPHPDPEIRIVGHQWWWELKYVDGPLQHHFTTANELHMPTGRPVDIEVQSADVIHSFWVPRLQGKVDLIPGQPNRIRLVANTAGTYEGQCSEYCGAQHAHMRILVIAQAPNDYAAWREQSLQPGHSPDSDEEKFGQQVFLRSACPLCHSVAGSLAQGLVGPNLTHIGSRRSLASNSLINNTANLQAWVTHAQALKPEVAMPNITQFTGAELRALVAYLRHLQ